jgi:ABC-2 type transport system ATP-binding protein
MAVIEVENLVKRYDGRAVVDDVSFAVEAGEIFAILGPNGAGKTTTVESIAGLRRPDGGRIRVSGLDPETDSAAVKELLGVQLQESRFHDKIRVGEALELFSSFYVSPVPWEGLLTDLGMGGTEETAFADLSGGQKQRLSIAVALVGDPRIAILDELTTGLDPKARRETWGLIEGLRDRGVTIVLVTHFMEEAERLADRVALIDGGRLVALDTPTGLIDRVSHEEVVRFRPASPIDDALLLALDEVSGISREGDLTVVTGTGNVLYAVVSLLARKQVVAQQLRVEQKTLDDAFLALTGKPLDEPTEPTES